MSTVATSLTNTQMKVRFREPYLSQALNQKYQNILPVGIYEGFDPVPGGGLLLKLQTGTTGHSAVVQSSTDTSTQVSVRLTGDIFVDLAAFPTLQVAVVLEVQYNFPAETTGQIVVYDLATETVPATACVLARVDVPVATIVASNIDLTGRTFSWDQRERDSIPFVNVVKNGDFALSNATSALTGNGSTNFWTLTGGTSGPEYYGFEVVVGGWNASTNAAQLFVSTDQFNNGYAATALQPLNVPVFTGQRIRVRYHIAAIDQGPAVMDMHFVASLRLVRAYDGTVSTLLSFTTTNPTTVWPSSQLVEHTFIVPTLGITGAALLESFTLEGYADEDPSGFGIGDSYMVSALVTDLAVEVEANSKAVESELGHMGPVRTGEIQLANAPQDKGAKLSYDSTLDRIVVGPQIGQQVAGTPGLYLPGTLTIGGGISIGGALNVVGDFSVNTDKLVVTAATGVSTWAATAKLVVPQIEWPGIGQQLNIGTDQISAVDSTARIDLGTSGYNTTINIGTTGPLSGPRTISIGSSSNTTISVLGTTVDIATSGNVTSVAVGTIGTSSMTVDLGYAAASGSTSTEIHGNSVSVGSYAHTQTLSLGVGMSTTFPTWAKTLTIGNNVNGGDLTVSLLGNEIHIGDTPLMAGNIYIGNSKLLHLEGAQVTIGIAATTTSVQLGRTGAFVNVDGILAVDGGSIDRSISGTIGIGTTALTTGTTIGRSGQTTTFPGVLDANGRIDRTLTTDTLSLGTVNADAVDIGRLTKMTTVKGDLTVDGNVTTGGAFYVNIDSALVGGTVTVGATNAGTVGIGKVGGSVIVTGTLNVDSGAIARSTAGALSVGNAAVVTDINIGTSGNTGDIVVGRTSVGTAVLQGATSALGSVVGSTQTSILATASGTISLKLGSSGTGGTIDINGTTGATSACAINVGSVMDAGTLTVGNSTGTSNVTNIAGRTLNVTGGAGGMALSSTSGSISVNSAITMGASSSLSMNANNISFSSGNGIDFSATAGATGTPVPVVLSEILSDYEEGTWSPVAAAGSSFFFSTVFDATNSGYYRKVGKLVFATARIISYNLNSATGAVWIKNLPFAPTGISGGFGGTGSVFAYAGFDAAWSGGFPSVGCDLSYAAFSLYAPFGPAVRVLETTDLTNGFYMYLSVTYVTDA